MALRSLRDAAEYADLAEFIRTKARGRKIFYAPNTGNWGDALIHFGTLQFLARSDISYRQLSRHDIFNLTLAIAPTGLQLPGTVLLAGGGGAWCNNYSVSRDFLSRCAALFEHVIVLPTTYALPALDLAPEQVTYFRRDQHHSADTIPQSLFCHDMAFFLELDGWIGTETLPSGNFFREDCERHPAAMPPADNLDISLMGDEQRHPLPFFRLLAKHRNIRTDRMHVAIASCLMGIPCELRPGNYPKSHDLFLSTIAPHFDNCSFIEW